MPRARMTAFLLASWCLLCGAGTSSAASDDRYVVATDRLNVRTTPSHESLVHYQIERGREVIELMRSQLWLYVRVRGEKPPRDKGWVHGWYLARQPDDDSAVLNSARNTSPPASTAQARPPVREATAADVLANARQPLREFKREYRRLADRYSRNTDARLFSRIREKPGRILVLTATEQWHQGTDADRQHDIYAILGLWKTANSDYSVFVEVRDAAGKLLLSAYD